MAADFTMFFRVDDDRYLIQVFNPDAGNGPVAEREMTVPEMLSYADQRDTPGSSRQAFDISFAARAGLLEPAALLTVLTAPQPIVVLV